MFQLILFIIKEFYICQCFSEVLSTLQISLASRFTKVGRGIKSRLTKYFVRIVVSSRGKYCTLRISFIMPLGGKFRLKHETLPNLITGL